MQTVCRSQAWMRRLDTLSRYVTRLLTVTFVACHPFPLCSASAVAPRCRCPAEQKCHRKTILKNNQELTMTSKWSASETPHTMRCVLPFLFILRHHAIHTSLTLTGSSCHVSSILFKLEGPISDFNSEVVWSHEILIGLRVFSKMTLSECTEGH